MRSNSRVSARWNRYSRTKPHSETADREVIDRLRSPGDTQVAKFITGSTMRHVIVMTATGSIGLVAIFIVDALNLFYISLLGVEELAAAVGFAATLLFFTISVAIGFTVACSALVSPAASAAATATEAARMGGASMVFMGAGHHGHLTIAIWPFLHELVALLGATGETLELSTRFLQIVLPSTPIVALGMCTTGILRGVGDARRAMYVTLGSGDRGGDPRSALHLRARSRPRRRGDLDRAGRGS